MIMEKNLPDNKRMHYVLRYNNPSIFDSLEYNNIITLKNKMNIINEMKKPKVQVSSYFTVPFLLYLAPVGPIF